MPIRIKVRLTSPDYPDWDRRSNAMPDLHRSVQMEAIRTLQGYFTKEPMVYVSGDTPVFFRHNGRRSHVFPDVYVVRDVPKGMRGGYRTCEEGKAPDWVLELTSMSSLREDAERKFALYQGILAVPEYFLFDPAGDSLEPRLQGYRLREGLYRRIAAVKGRVPSQALGLHLEAHATELRFYDPPKRRRQRERGCTNG